MTDVGLIGPGRVGRTLGRLLPQDSYRLGPVLGGSIASSRRAVREMRRGRAAHGFGDFSGCQLLLIATPEAELDATLRRLAESMETTGVTGLVTAAFHEGEGFDAFRDGGGSVASLFPLQTFQRPPATLASVYFVVAGDAPAVRAARRLVRGLGAQAQVATRDTIGRVAVGANVATEVFVGLLDFASRQMTAAGFPRWRGLEALRVLFVAAFDDFLRSGRAARLGPLLGQDHDGVRRRIAGLAASDAADAELYRQALALTLALVAGGDDGSRPPAPSALGGDGSGLPCGDS